MSNLSKIGLQTATVSQDVLDEINAVRDAGMDLITEMRFAFHPDAEVTDEMVREAALDFENIMANSKPLRLEDWNW